MLFLFLALCTGGVGSEPAAAESNYHEQGIEQGVRKVTDDPLVSIQEAIQGYFEREGAPLSREQFSKILRDIQADKHPNLGDYYVVTTTAGEFWVKTDKKKVIKYSAYPRFSVKEARQYAHEYLLRHINNFDIRNFVQDRAELDEPYWIEEYTEQPKQGRAVSIFENWISITVNLDSRSVQEFNASEISLVRTSYPAISEAEARKKILSGYPEGQIVELKLMEYTTDGGATSRTIWSASLTPDDDPLSPLQMLSIDADTGIEVP